MSIFNFVDYKEFAVNRIKQMPLGGRGEFQRLSVALQMHTTSVSQVFKGQKNLTSEQAARLCNFWGLSPAESDYLLTLVELERAGTQELKKLLQQRLEKMKEKSGELGQRVPKGKTLSDADRYRFYSQWYYSAIRLLCDIPKLANIDRMADHLNLKVDVVNDVLQFLLRSELVIEKNGKLELGPKRTFLEASSTLVARHHGNWRVKAIEAHRSMNLERDLAITSPMTISAKDSQKVREILLEAVEKILKINTDSPSEELRVLNIDWLGL